MCLRWGSAHKKKPLSVCPRARILIPEREIKHIFHGACRHEWRQCPIAVPSTQRAIRKAACACAGVLRAQKTFKRLSRIPTPVREIKHIYPQRLPVWAVQNRY